MFLGAVVLSLVLIDISSVGGCARDFENSSGFIIVHFIFLFKAWYADNK